MSRESASSNQEYGSSSSPEAAVAIISVNEARANKKQISEWLTSLNFKKIRLAFEGGSQGTAGMGHYAVLIAISQYLIHLGYKGKFVCTFSPDRAFQLSFNRSDQDKTTFMNEKIKQVKFLFLDDHGPLYSLRSQSYRREVDLTVSVSQFGIPDKKSGFFLSVAPHAWDICESGSILQRWQSDTASEGEQFFELDENGVVGRYYQSSVKTQVLSDGLKVLFQQQAQGNCYVLSIYGHSEHLGFVVNRLKDVIQGALKTLSSSASVVMLLHNERIPTNQECVHSEQLDQECVPSEQLHNVCEMISKKSQSGNAFYYVHLGRVKQAVFVAIQDQCFLPVVEGANAMSRLQQTGRSWLHGFTNATYKYGHKRFFEKKSDDSLPSNLNAEQGLSDFEQIHHYACRYINTRTRIYTCQDDEKVDERQKCVDFFVGLLSNRPSWENYFQQRAKKFCDNVDVVATAIAALAGRSLPKQEEDNKNTGSTVSPYVIPTYEVIYSKETEHASLDEGGKNIDPPSNDGKRNLSSSQLREFVKNASLDEGGKNIDPPYDGGKRNRSSSQLRGFVKNASLDEGGKNIDPPSDDGKRNRSPSRLRAFLKVEGIFGITASAVGVTTGVLAFTYGLPLLGAGLVVTPVVVACIVAAAVGLLVAAGSAISAAMKSCRFTYAGGISALEEKGIGLVAK